ncbi:MAG: polysaccharide pyruvyl transferase family protein [Planctomycetota bacterium]|jgi:polysaccharide pyruvyl transferase WcaK-like protein
MANNSNTSFLFVGNGSYLNRGCEAIVRGTVRILRHAFTDPKFVNANFDLTNPPFTPKESDSGVIHKPVVLPKKWSPKWVFGQVLKRTKDDLANSFYFGAIKNAINESAAVLSVGGDNYSLDYGIPWLFINLDRYVLKHNKPLIIWGASVGHFDSEPDFAGIMHRHLKEEVSAIFVREEKSLEYLEKYGIRKNVYLMSDPAFSMEPESVQPEQIGFDLPKEAIGLNLSPLMIRYIGDRKRETLVKITLELLFDLRKTTERPIVLVSHVTSPHSNDHGLLGEIYKKLTSKNDIYLLPDNLNAAQVKWVISKLACLIASRTHATIAAFSTCVPTVSLAYSAKAYGLNKMLFGHTFFVVKPEDFYPGRIMKKVTMVLDQKSQIKKTLESNMPGIQDLALDAGIQLRKVLEN